MKVLAIFLLLMNVLICFGLNLYLVYTGAPLFLDALMVGAIIFYAVFASVKIQNYSED